MYRKFVPCSLVLAASLAFTAHASAATWAEVGDAGDLPGTAQTTVGGGPLTAITGSIGTRIDRDLFCIIIDGMGPFSASTVGTPGTLGDTQLFLFDAMGFGVLGNDDASGATLRSTLSGTLAPGTYYLGISGFDVDPVSAGG